jgi:hypothetical protein
MYHLYLQGRRGAKTIREEDIETARLVDSFQQRLSRQLDITKKD